MVEGEELTRRTQWVDMCQEIVDELEKRLINWVVKVERQRKGCNRSSSRIARSIFSLKTHFLLSKAGLRRISGICNESMW